MTRYKLILEYDGSAFIGWQRQKYGQSIQGAIEVALFNIEGRNSAVRGAGRTDAGVHASGQVAHCDLVKDWQEYRLCDALNAHLRPLPIAILSSSRVSVDFDARFSAIRRHYLYRIVNRRAPLSLEAKRTWHVKRPIDACQMHKAAQRLLGRHDFSTFRDSQCQAHSPIRTLESFTVVQTDRCIEIHVVARSFLHRQVRSMVGSLVQVGSGRWSEGDLVAALEARDRARCGPIAPACGLYLHQIDYR